MVGTGRTGQNNQERKMAEQDWIEQPAGMMSSDRSEWNT
jgi:hypothetical protein